MKYTARLWQPHVPVLSHRCHELQLDVTMCQASSGSAELETAEPERGGRSGGGAGREARRCLHTLHRTLQLNPGSPYSVINISV